MRKPKIGDVIRAKLPKNWRPWKFNKKNAIRFANEVLAKVKLCRGQITDDKCEMSCAIGEAVLRFLPREQHPHYVYREYGWVGVNDGTQTALIRLREAAGMDDYGPLNEVVRANDRSPRGKARNKAVTEAWLKNVVPLLK